MSRGRRWLVKGLFALLASLPATTGLGIYFVLSLAGGLQALATPAKSHPGSPAMMALWGFAGLLGLAGSWTWVFLPRGAGPAWRAVTAGSLFAGLCALLLLVPGAWTSGLAWAVWPAFLAGLVQVAWLVQPRLAFNPDAPLPAA